MDMFSKRHPSSVITEIKPPKALDINK